MTTEANTNALYALDPDCELPPRLLQLFLRSAPGQLQALLDASASREVEAARAQAHKLKGGLYAAGASGLAARVEALRGCLATSDWSGAEAELRLICDEFKSLLAELTRQLERGGA